MKLMDYIKAAFNARPAGMFIAPNWIGLALLGFLGLVNPGFWLLGAGLELCYLYSLVFNSRFRRYVQATLSGQTQLQWQQNLGQQLTQLSPADRDRYLTLQSRCLSIPTQGQSSSEAAAAAQGQSFARLLWIYLRLLLTRQAISKVLSEVPAKDRDDRGVAKRLADIKSRLERTDLDEGLRNSLTAQAQILQQRLDGQAQARSKMDFLEAELTRIEEQVELIREQAVLTTDPMAVSQRIDQVSATLGDTSQWIREQQQIYGQVEEFLAEPPPIVLPAQQATQKQ